MLIKGEGSPPVEVITCQRGSSSWEGCPTPPGGRRGILRGGKNPTGGTHSFSGPLRPAAQSESILVGIPLRLMAFFEKAVKPLLVDFFKAVIGL